MQEYAGHSPHCKCHCIAFYTGHLLFYLFKCQQMYFLRSVLLVQCSIKINVTHFDTLSSNAITFRDFELWLKCPNHIVCTTVFCVSIQGDYDALFNGKNKLDICFIFLLWVSNDDCFLSTAKGQQGWKRTVNGRG